jgi:hypothetical protein
VSALVARVPARVALSAAWEAFVEAVMALVEAEVAEPAALTAAELAEAALFATAVSELAAAVALAAAWEAFTVAVAAPSQPAPWRSLLPSCRSGRRSSRSLRPSCCP